MRRPSGRPGTRGLYLTDWRLEPGQGREVDGRDGRSQARSEHAPRTAGLAFAHRLRVGRVRRFSRAGPPSGAAHSAVPSLASDEDFVPAFPTPVSMRYQLDGEGRRVTRKLSDEEQSLLRGLDARLTDAQWHPCAIGVAAAPLVGASLLRHEPTHAPNPTLPQQPPAIPPNTGLPTHAQALTVSNSQTLAPSDSQVACLFLFST